MAGVRTGREAEETSVDLKELLADAGLTRTGAALFMGKVRLGRIAEKVGTPVYVYNAEVVRERYRQLDAAFGDIPHSICYAIKANSNLAILGVLRDLGAGADIVSGGEMRRALHAGFPPERIVFSGVGKTGAELEAAVRAGVGHVHIESVEEMKELGDIAASRQRRMLIGIRVNPEVTADTHPFIATGQGGIKFGVPYDQVLDLATAIKRHKWLELDTVAMHLGSQLLATGPYSEGVERLLLLVSECASPHRLRSCRCASRSTLRTVRNSSTRRSEAATSSTGTCRMGRPSVRFTPLPKPRCLIAGSP